MYDKPKHVDDIIKAFEKTPDMPHERVVVLIHPDDPKYLEGWETVSFGKLEDLLSYCKKYSSIQSIRPDQDSSSD